jgi:hypothetical protein
LGSYLIASSFILMSSTSTSPYFCTIKVHNLVRLVGVGCKLLNHSLAHPLEFSFAILKSLFTFKSHTFAGILSLYPQSLTSSWSHPPYHVG